MFKWNHDTRPIHKHEQGTSHAQFLPPIHSRNSTERRDSLERRCGWLCTTLSLDRTEMSLSMLLLLHSLTIPSPTMCSIMSLSRLLCGAYCDINFDSIINFESKLNSVVISVIHHQVIYLMILGMTLTLLIYDLAEGNIIHDLRTEPLWFVVLDISCVSLMVFDVLVQV